MKLVVSFSDASVSLPSPDGRAAWLPPNGLVIPIEREVERCKMKKDRRTLQIPLLFLCLVPFPALAQGMPAGQPAPDLKGTWSGTLVHAKPEAHSAPISISISADPTGALVGTTALESKCVKNPRLKVRINGSDVALIGSDPEGDSLSLKGTLDSTGKVLTMTFTANGSASGRCESIRGTATLKRQ